MKAPRGTFSLMLLILLYLSSLAPLLATEANVKPTEVLQHPSLQKAQLIIIADHNHNSAYLKQGFVDLIKEISALYKDVNCLFLEEDRTDMQQALDDYSSGRGSYYDTYETARKKWAKKTGISFVIATKEMLHLAKTESIKTFAVDEYPFLGAGEKLNALFEQGFQLLDMGRAAESRPLLLEAIDIGISGRNLMMANNILNHFKKNECSRGIFIVGSAHLSYWDEYPDWWNLERQSFVPIQAHLNASLLSNEVINLTDCEELDPAAYDEDQLIRACQQLSTQNFNYELFAVSIPPPVKHRTHAKHHILFKQRLSRVGPL